MFDKLNSIGNNERVLLLQAYDEMMGHQYANTQQRINSTGRILDKEFSYLKGEWQTASKESNKMKIFGSRDEYKTDTAGIIDYTSNAYGVAYVNEDETIKLGNSTGWYLGAVNNSFKFKDIGKSKEDSTMLKAGVYRAKAFDDNGSLQWTIAGEGFVTRSDMHRKFLVVDEIFNAESTYYTYGAAVKNEISKNFRASERFSIVPYGSLKLEYGRTGNIKEKVGEIYCHKVELTKNINKTLYFFDTKTYMLLKEVKKDETLEYSDFKMVGSLLMPYRIVSVSPKKDSDYVMILNKIETNKVFPANTFKF